MTKPLAKVTTAYRCNDYSTVGWAVELNNDGEFFGVGGTWAEALCNAVWAKFPERNGDIKEFNVVVPNAVRSEIKLQIEECGAEGNFKI